VDCSLTKDAHGRRRGDLVFLQNGMIAPWLREHQLHTSTRALLYFGGAILQPPSPNVTLTYP
jgi:hypothetical protein